MKNEKTYYSRDTGQRKENWESDVFSECDGVRWGMRWTFREDLSLSGTLFFRACGKNFECLKLLKTPSSKVPYFVFVDGKEVELIMPEADMNVAEKRAAELRAIAERLGYKPGWVWHKLYDRFGLEAAEKLCPR